MLFCIVYCSESRLKINIIPYGELCYYLTYRDEIKLWKVTFLKGFTTEKLWNGLPFFCKYRSHRVPMHLRWPALVIGV